MSNFIDFYPVSASQSQHAPNQFMASTADALATVEASGYLDDLQDAGVINPGDIIFINYGIGGTPGETGGVATTSGSNLNFVVGTPGSSGSGGSGTVTSVALTAPAEFSVAGSPVTTSGTLAITKAVQNANKVFAGPTTGADAQPAFRALVAADVPSGLPYLSDVLSSAKILVGNVSNVATAVNVTGDVGIDNAGATTIAAGAVNNAKIAAGAAIAFAKLAVLASGNILVGDAGGVAKSVAMSGDTTIDNTGAVTIGNSKVTRAKLGAAEQLLLPYAATNAAISAGSPIVIVTVAGMVSTDVVLANLKASTLPVNVQKVTAGTGSFTILFSGDPGAASTVDYVAYHTV